MASELLKNRALIQKLKEPEIPRVKFDLASTGFEELFTLPEPKPQELLDIQEDVRIQRQQDTMDKARPFLMDESVDFIERENFAEAGFVFANQKFNVDIPNLTPVQSKSFQKGLKDLEKWLKNPNAENWIETFRTPSKTGQTHQSEFSLNLRKYLQGQPVKARAKELFDSVDIKNLLGDTVKDIQTYTPQEFRRVSNLPKSKKAAEVALNKSMKAASAVRDVFVGNPDADLEDVARGIFGKDFDKADLVVKEDMLSKASDDTAKFLEAVTANRKVKGFKPISADKLGDIIQNIEDNTKDFKFREGTIREYRFRIRDSLLGIETESAEGFRNLRNVVGGTDKGKVVDEVFGLSATFKNAPGYVENVQLIDKKINNIKGKQIDKPFSAIVNAVKNKKDVVQYEGQEMDISKAIQKFNAKSKAFSKKNKVSTPQIFVGDNLDPTKLVSNFNKYSPQAQLDIIEQATNDGFVLNATKPSTPAGSFIKKTGRADLKDPTKKLTAFQKLASGKNVGFDPILATKAGFEEFVKPAAKIGARGAAGAANLLLSAGAGPIGLGVGALIETGQAMPELTKGNIKEAGRRTIIGSLLPEKLVGSMQTDLLKLAKTPEEKIGMQNYIDFQNDSDRFRKRFANYQYLEANPFEAEGIDIEAMEKGLLNEYLELQARKPKIINKEVGDIITTLTDRLDAQNVENLEGFLGSIVGRRGIDNREQIKQDIEQQVITGNEPILGQAPVQMSPEELDEIYESGIMAMANGGRISFADGPIDPKRRLFLKIMGGIASLPVFGKFLGKSEVAKPIVKVAGSSTKMPDWFPNLINKVMFSGTGKRVDADLTVYEPKELPGISIGRYDDGRVFVEGENEYGKKYMIEYEPPGFELIDEKTGKAVKKPGEFIAQEEVPVNVDPDGNADFDVEVLDDLDQILGSDTRAMEEFATGRKVKDMKQGEFAVGKAEADVDRAIEEAAEMAEDID